MGQALKKVYRSEITVDDSVHLAKKEIGEVFENSKDAEPEKDTNIGIFGEIVGKCPLCEKDVIRTKFGYGCTGYKDGCKFTVNKSICKRVISLSNVKMLLATGKTSKIQGFVSKNGKTFDAVLKLDENGKIIFDFN